ncbi:uncharacterized protein LOC111212078 [Brassica napus]|uniref:uncharacterized protein LOC111212078 n=1 Tax=Brassica napus TaxID=3708 RepID=UPI0006AAEF0F|nr:uncharacterized protein LOC111212078 [Brassica napus]
MEYRPIALCNVYYKIISKILTRRLQPLLLTIISENQSAFVPGRAISDNVLITHEVLHYLKTSEAEVRCAMAVKTDMSKAYDRLEWEFIALVLRRMGFHPKWITLIMECITTVTYSFLINGSPRGRIQPSRGIRQGDPLSPYIFILCSEVLSGLCNKAQADGSLKGIKVARGCPRVNHFLFVDDTMFFVDASKEGSKTLKRLLTRYEEASGQANNTEKSSISFSKRTSDQVKASAKSSLQIQNEGGVGKYLGLPKHFGRRKKDMFASIVDKIKQKAKSWKNRFLSTAGKLVMLKSVLNAMPSHSMTCFKLPVSLCKRIQSAVTRFWWDSNSETRKMAWVSWDDLSQTKSNGGLGFRDFLRFNDAFLAKLRWRLLHHPDCLLARILFGKYCQDEVFLHCSDRTAESHGWRGVLLGRDLLLRNMGWTVGDGKQIKAWSDPWLSTSCQARPMGHPMERHIDITVEELFHDGTTEWNQEVIQLIFPFEAETILTIKPSILGAPDKLFWVHTRDGEYTTKSGYVAAVAYKNEQDERPQMAHLIDWNKGVWNLKTAPKIQLLVWKALRGALPVGEKLLARQINVDPMCKRCGKLESINHLLFQCEFAETVWNSAPFAHRIDRRQLLDLENDWMRLIENPCLPPVGIVSGQLAPWIVWNLWTARNKMIFNDKGFTAEEVVTQAVAAAREWLNAQNKEEKRVTHPKPSRTALAWEVVVQTDAAWNATSKSAGLGWSVKNIGRNSEFQATAELVVSPLVAEGLAMRNAVKMCKELGLRHIRYESDSSQLIKALNSKTEPPEIYGIVSDIRIECMDFETSYFVWIPRERNVVADRLAKQALSRVSSGFTTLL